MRAAKPIGVLVIVSCSLLSACNSAAPTSLSYAGEWSGTTTQGVPISFTISSDDRLTSISLAHNFNGCSGSQTFANLNLPIAMDIPCQPGPCPAPLSSYRGFFYTDNPTTLDDRPATFVTGHFSRLTLASGAVGFRNYPGCGAEYVYATWTASRH
jgi:hypothetical protein